MRQIVITEKMLDQLVGEAQDRIRDKLRYGDHELDQYIRGMLERLGEDIKDSAL